MKDVTDALNQPGIYTLECIALDFRGSYPKTIEAFFEKFTKNKSLKLLHIQGGFLNNHTVEMLFEFPLLEELIIGKKTRMPKSQIPCIFRLEHLKTLVIVPRFIMTKDIIKSMSTLKQTKVSINAKFKDTINF
jgi:hypothetical protein